MLKVLLGRGGTDIGSEGERRRPSRSQPWADPSHRRRSTWRPTFLRLQAGRGQRAGAPSTLLARRSGCRGHRSGIARQRRARAPSRRRVGERRPRIIRHRRGGHLHNGQHDARRKRHRTSSAGQEPSAFGGNKSALSSVARLCRAVRRAPVAGCFLRLSLETFGIAEFCLHLGTRAAGGRVPFPQPPTPSDTGGSAALR